MPGADPRGTRTSTSQRRRLPAGGLIDPKEGPSLRRAFLVLVAFENLTGGRSQSPVRRFAFDLTRKYEVCRWFLLSSTEGRKYGDMFTISPRSTRSHPLHLHLRALRGLCGEYVTAIPAPEH